MKNEKLKVRLIKDEKIFDNIQAGQIGLMGSGGSGSGSGGRTSFALSIPIHGTASLNGYSWDVSGNVDVYTIVDLIKKRQKMTPNIE